MPTHSRYLAGLDTAPALETYNPSYAQGAAAAAEVAPPSRPQVMPSFGLPPQAAPSPAVYYNPSQKKLSVNGVVFDEADHDKAVRSQDALNRPAAPPPEGMGWNLLPDVEYQKYIDKIVDPSLGRVISKNLSIGADIYKLTIGGYGAQYLGAEGFGKEVVEEQIEALRFNAPYQKEALEIRGVGDAGMWLAGLLAQQGAQLAEMIIAGVIGAAVGTVAGGPGVGTLFGAIGGLALRVGGRKALVKKAMEAAKRKLSKEGVTKADDALLQEMAVIYMARKKRQIGGAYLGIAGGNLAFGTSDIYGEQLESGTPNKGTALALGTVYAALDTLPEFFALGYFAKGARVPWRGNKLRRAKGVAGALGVGGALEGFAEGSQEALLLTQNEGVDFGSEEGIKRLINSTLAGFAVGGTIATGAAVLRRGKEPESRPKIDDIGKDDLNLVEIEPTPGLTPSLPPLEGQPIEEPTAPDESTPGLTPQLPPLEGQEIEELVSEPVLDEQAAEPEEGMFPPDAPVDPALLAPDNPPPAVGEAFRAVYAEQDAAQDEQFLPAEQQAAEQRAAEQLRNEQELAAVQPLSTQMDLPLPPVDIPFPDNMTPATEPPSPVFTGEPTINMPHRVNETGEVVMRPVTVREAIETSNQRVNALEELAMCLGGK